MLNTAPEWETSHVGTVTSPNVPEQAATTRFSTYLDGIVGAAILLSTFMLGLETDHATVSMELKDRVLWIVSESIFMLVFLVEIPTRMYIDRWNWPWTIWNWFDITVLVLMIVETWVLSLIKNGQILQEQNGLRVLGIVQCARLGRFLRVFKLFRVMRFLQATVATFRDSISGLFYVALIMVAGVWVCAIFMTQAVGRTQLQYTEFSDGHTASERFGNVPRSIWTLFELMTLEQWQVTGRPLVEAEPFMALFFCTYIMVFTFGLMNMIVAVIVQYALFQSKRMFEVEVDMEMRAVANDLEVMQNAFKECDINSDGTIYRSEFVEAVNDTTGAFAACLERLEITTQDAEMLFEILDSDVSGGVSSDEFLDGCARVLGASDPNWDGLATHACAVGLTKQFQEFRNYMEQTGRFSSSSSSPSLASMVRSQSSSPCMRLPMSSLQQPGKTHVEGHLDSDRTQVQPCKSGSPQLVPECVIWQQDTERQLRLNEQLLTQLNKDMIDEIVQEKDFLERLGNVERSILPTVQRVSVS